MANVKVFPDKQMNKADKLPDQNLYAHDLSREGVHNKDKMLFKGIFSFFPIVFRLLSQGC